ncbi:unnamed protein product [Paramecium primaurelia]|uniref:RRM domain-containing protein n=1 Tax=Paramecium primaurelia TaxID=5886 RepID=A0A8S1KWD3_PARPR|nr:unnamed protein product [Paramecium primaurelia]
MGEIVPNQLFVAGYSRNKISDEKGIKDIFKKYGNIKDVAYKGSYSFVTFSSESEAEDALKALNGQSINGQKLKVDVVDNRKTRRNGPQENDQCFKCGKGGLESVQTDHHQEEEDILIQDQDIEDQEDQIQDLVLILLIHLLTLGEGETLRSVIDTVEEAEVQEEIIRERKVPVKRDLIQIQGPDHQLAINRDSHTSHLLLNEKGSNKEKEIRNQINRLLPFFIPFPIISELLLLIYRKTFNMSNSQAIEKLNKFCIQIYFLRHFYYYQFIEKMNERFEQNLQEILSRECQTVYKNLLLKGQIELIKQKIRDQKQIKQQQDQELREIEKIQVMQNLKEEQQKQIEEKEIQLIKQKKELHLRLDACEDLQFEIEQQYEHLQIQQENQKILDESIKRLMDCIQRIKKPIKNQQYHNRVATSHSFDDRNNGFGIMGMLKSKNNVDDYIQKVEKINTSRLFDH